MEKEAGWLILQAIRFKEQGPLLKTKGLLSMSSKFSLTAIDHFVLTVRNIEKSVRFYRDTLGCPIITFGDNRFAVQIGSSKINLHQADSPIVPHASVPTCGSADFCLLTDSSVGEIQNYLLSQNIEIELGPVARSGAAGPITSFYVRDPDGNLIEIATLKAN